jgi:hypothetical protein
MKKKQLSTCTDKKYSIRKKKNDRNKKATLYILPIASTPQPRHRPISLLKAFFCLHPIAIEFSSIEKCLQFFTGLWFTIFAVEHFSEIFLLRWPQILQQQVAE